jgi:hypothetical protein
MGHWLPVIATRTDGRDLSYPATAALSGDEKPILFPDGSLDADDYTVTASDAATSVPNGNHLLKPR